MGGTWTTQNKVLPGAYVNFLSNRPLAIDIADRGIVSIPMVMNWGETGKLYEVFPTDNTLNTLGYDLSNSALMPIREALKCASRVLAYKVNDGVSAKITVVAGVTATAKQKGIRGNDISVVVAENGTEWDIRTFVAGDVVDTQTVIGFSDFEPNDWIEITGTGTIGAATVNLTGGTNTTPSETDYTGYLTAMKTQFFNVIAYTGTDIAIINKIVAFVKDQRENEGVKVQAVVSGIDSDYEGIIVVDNGVVLNDGSILTKNDACAWVAGATAGAKITESNTNKKYDGAIDVNPRLTKSEKVSKINSGKFIFTVNESQNVTGLYDINSLTTFSAAKSKDFRKNRVIRTLDNINNDIVTIFESNYMGKIDNNEVKRSVLRASLIEYFKELQRLGAIQNFINDDVTVNAGIDSDSVVIDAYVQPVDSAEKFYTTVHVA